MHLSLLLFLYIQVYSNTYNKLCFIIFFTVNSQLDRLALVAENTALKEEKEKLLQANCNFQHQFSEQQQSSIKRFAYQNLSNKDCHYYTGFSKEQFDDIYTFLVPTADDLSLIHI